MYYGVNCPLNFDQGCAKLNVIVLLKAQRYSDGAQSEQVLTGAMISRNVIDTWPLIDPLPLFNCC